jgi:hypothetical protein
MDCNVITHSTWGNIGDVSLVLFQRRREEKRKEEEFMKRLQDQMVD